MAIKKYIWLLLLIVTVTHTYGQIGTYDYKRELTGVSDTWHSIPLPNAIFGKVSQELSDIRIYGITAASDTVEAPYIFRLATGKVKKEEVAFKMLNVSYNNKGYFATFKVPEATDINEIKLDFKQQNFDWKLTLEGSVNQQDWFTITDDYRILSIKNEITDYSFTKVKFPSANYTFFRIQISSKEKPELLKASLSKTEIKEGVYTTFTSKNTLVKEDKKQRQTIIETELLDAVPLSHIKIAVKDTFDYYRPVTISYVSDSVKTAKGWIYNYRNLTTATLNSIEENEFSFKSTTLKKIKITIHNQHNQGLRIGTITAKGYKHKLIARFTTPASYFLSYGKKNDYRPTYDIAEFSDKIPETLSSITVGEEQQILKIEPSKQEALFKNKFWLWGIMAIIIALMGWFSLKMLKQK